MIRPHCDEQRLREPPGVAVEVGAGDVGCIPVAVVGRAGVCGVYGVCGAGGTAVGGGGHAGVCGAGGTAGVVGGAVVACGAVVSVSVMGVLSFDDRNRRRHCNGSDRHSYHPCNHHDHHHSTSASSSSLFSIFSFAVAACQ